MLSNAVSTFSDWLAEPFSEDMSAFQWGLFLGLLLVLLTIWKMIFMHIEGGL